MLVHFHSRLPNNFQRQVLILLKRKVTMLLLGKEQLQSKVIEGLQLFPDHENPKQWWYLSGPVRLAERDNKSQFTLIKYNKNAKEQGAQGGGFVTFEVNVGLSENVQKEIREEIEREKGIKKKKKREVSNA